MVRPVCCCARSPAQWSVSRTLHAKWATAFTPVSSVPALRVEAAGRAQVNWCSPDNVNLRSRGEQPYCMGVPASDLESRTGSG